MLTSAQLTIALSYKIWEMRENNNSNHDTYLAQYIVEHFKQLNTTITPTTNNVHDDIVYVNTGAEIPVYKSIPTVLEDIADNTNLIVDYITGVTGTYVSSQGTYELFRCKEHESVQLSYKNDIWRRVYGFNNSILAATPPVISEYNPVTGNGGLTYNSGWIKIYNQVDRVHMLHKQIKEVMRIPATYNEHSPIPSNIPQINITNVTYNTSITDTPYDDTHIYKTGINGIDIDDTISINVTFDNTVTVTGTPILYLNIKNINITPRVYKYATYSTTSSPPTTITFTYTLVSGDYTPTGTFLNYVSQYALYIPGANHISSITGTSGSIINPLMSVPSNTNAMGLFGYTISATA